MSLFDRLAGFVIPAAQAHEKWFVPVEPVTSAAPQFYHAVNAWTVGAAIAIATVAIAGWFVDRWYEKTPLYGRIEKKIRPLRDFAAGALGITTAVTLLIMSSRGMLLAQNFPLEPGPAATVLLGVQSVIGMLLLIGLFTRAAAIGLIALLAATFALFPWIDAMDYLHFLGIGIFLIAFARGRFSMDWFLGKPITTTAKQRKVAYVAMRVITGFTIIWLGFLKLRRPDLHFSLMDRYSDFNPYVIAHWLGIDMSREAYVFLLFAAEVAIGTFETAGLLTRFAAFTLFPLFMASAMFLGAGELVGHLPILGVLFVLFVFGDTYYKEEEPERKPPPRDPETKPAP